MSNPSVIDYMMFAVAVVIFLPILMLLLSCILCTMVISIIPLAIVGIVDLALVGFNGLRSIKSFITSHNMQIKRESIYRKAGSAVPAMDLRIKYRHKSLLMLTINSLAREVDKHNPTATFAGGLKEFFKYALLPLRILNNAFGLRSDTKSCLKRSLQASRYIELTYKRQDSSMVKIYFGRNINGNGYLFTKLPDEIIVHKTGTEYVNCVLSAIYLAEQHYMDSNKTKDSIIADLIAGVQDLHCTCPAVGSTAAEIIEAEQRLLNAISTMVDIHYQGKSLASAVPAESITVNNAEHLPGNTEERSKTP